MKVYISNYLSRSISIIDYSTLELEKEIYFNESIYPHHFCIDKDEGLIYIPSSSNGILYVVSLDTKKIVDSISIGGNLSQIMLYNNEIFISNEDSNSIYIIDKKDLTPIGIIGVDNMPHGFKFDIQTKKLYVPCINSIVCIDLLSKEVVRKIDVDFKAWHISIDKKKKEIYTSTLDGKIIILDEDTLEVKTILDGFLLPVEISFNYTENKFYVTDLGYKNVKILDYPTGKYLGHINVCGIPQGLEVSTDEKLLFVSDTQKNCIKVYETCSNMLIKEIKVGKEPTTILCV